MVLLGLLLVYISKHSASDIFNKSNNPDAVVGPTSADWCRDQANICLYLNERRLVSWSGQLLSIFERAQTGVVIRPTPAYIWMSADWCRDHDTTIFDISLINARIIGIIAIVLLHVCLYLPMFYGSRLLRPANSVARRHPLIGSHRLPVSEKAIFPAPTLLFFGGSGIRRNK